MNELTLYQKHPKAWVFVLAHKYLKGQRFERLLEDFEQLLSPEDLKVAREMWEENR